MVKTARVIAITSGKGGVGKTHICANLGILLVQQGLRTCIVDADHGQANINIILGLKTTSPSSNIFDKTSTLAQAMVTTPEGLDILPATSGVSQKNDQPAPSKEELERLFLQLKSMYDIVLIDTAAGIDQGVLDYLMLADHLVLTITPEPTSLTDGFGLVRAMSKTHRSIEVITNRVGNVAAANEIYRRFSKAVKSYIGVQTSLLGYIGEDPYVGAAVLAQTALVSYRPGCSASRSLQRISLALSRKLNYPSTEPKPGKLNQDHKTNTEASRGSRAGSSSPVISPIPASPSFIQTKTKVEPFTNWLVQMDDFVITGDVSDAEKLQRTQQLLRRLTLLSQSNSLLESALDDFVEQFLEEKKQQISPPPVSRVSSRKGAAKVLTLISHLKQKPYVNLAQHNLTSDLSSLESDK